MGFETSKFGDGSAAGSGNVVTTVNNHYGPRTSGKTQGVVKTEGTYNELTFQVDAAMVSAEAFPLLAPKLPAGAVIKDVTVWVEEAFALGGTTPVIEIGTEGSEATNGFTISEAQAEAAGVFSGTAALSGTWAAPLAAETTVGIDLAGTTPTVGTAGKMRVTIHYIDNRL